MFKVVMTVAMVVNTVIVLFLRHCSKESYEAFNSMCSLQDKINAEYEGLIEKWKKSYLDLQKDYGALLTENESLREEIERLDNMNK